MMDTNLRDFDRLWDYDNPQDTERAFRDLLPAAQEPGNVAYMAELLTQIARAQGLQRQFEAAHQTLDEAEALLREDLIRARIRYLLERGRVFNSSKNTARARDLFLQAWQIASEHGEGFHAIDAAHMMGIIEPPAQQLDWNLRALDLAERSTDARAQGWRGSLYNNIGWTYHDLGRYEEALELFSKALDWSRQEGQAREIRIASWCVGRALRSLGRVAEALGLQRDLLGQIEAAGDADGYVHEELGECLLALGRQDEAQAHFARAYAVLSQDAWLIANETPRLQRLKELAGTSSQ